MRDKFFPNAKRKFSVNPVLTVKWTILTSLFIFIIFTIFAVITYKTSTYIMVRQERHKIEENLKEIDERLQLSNHDLSISTTAYYLRESNDQLVGEPSPETIEGNFLRLNSFISVLSQPELTMTVYDSHKQLVFETKQSELKYRGKKKMQVKSHTINHRKGFLATKAVYSRESKKLIGYLQLFYDLSSVGAIQRQLRQTLVLLEIVAVVVSLLLGLTLSSYFLKPLKDITRTIRTIKSDPQTQERLPILATNDEFAELTHVFNEMLDRMQRFIAQQQQFVEDVSHELRTPVAIIEGHLKLLNRWGKDDPAVLEESLTASLTEITRMKTLVQEMLDLTRLGQIEFQHQHDSCLALEVVKQTYENFQLLYPDFIFILDIDVSTHERVAIYRNHFEQLLIIVLDNAVKYSLNRKEIHISVATANQQLELAIQDFGQGIPPEDVERVFHRFYRVDKARSRNQGGTGLGLSIAQELVANYKGEIAVESVVNQGTIIRILLPLVVETIESESL